MGLIEEAVSRLPRSGPPIVDAGNSPRIKHNRSLYPTNLPQPVLMQDREKCKATRRQQKQPEKSREVKKEYSREQRDSSKRNLGVAEQAFLPLHCALLALQFGESLGVQN